MSQEFAIRPVSPYAFALPGLALVAAAAGVIVVMYRGDPKVAWVFPIMLLSAGLITSILRRRRVSLEDGVLTVAAGFNTRRVGIGEIDVDGARIVDLAEHTSLKPALKVMGSSLPGYNAGHFRLRDRSKAFLLLSSRSRVLVLPEKNGAKLLLSLERPQALLDALQRVAERRPAR
ncbi:hypothetical protein FCE95_05540 [Luteimonas gilva]|uniref:Bacterial Pleckstrin homology domain-containing protein n=1 Tax=Luteimonas gilva TaxID=2572684 RepID=A0A4V5ZQN7_9GAMM|nr:PH domain-containing protein [Luteimonas gilva]TKR33743.1 hypothetical protein FCE95_05540 [Luteimonas gilva]